ncbi:hypothetical protein HMPREF9332_01239 [Alloprevotella rava F0323]|uniref:GLPGLI family protein n=1 Tax=Alloprevotella rava F0323 TaxID=679199 RepID=G5GCG2_9BACT|nr:GLPGLI family protein [Alloprevotella rava]EHG22741.1 hypothetical protein HMPREF9332_01239 [Alloprevotella rava F0323]
MRIIMSVVLAFIAMLAPAQEVKMKPLAPIEVEVSYELDQLCDYSQEVGESDWREKSTLLLEIGKGMVHSYVVEEHHKLIDQFVMQRSKNRWRVTLFNVHALVGETFMAYPKVGELTQVVNLDAAGVFQYVEDIPDFKWKILSKSKVIMGYNCQCATTTFRGRDYEAWFTADIPLSCGPWKFHGLPGLILEVADVKNEFHFTVNGISQIKGKKISRCSMKRYVASNVVVLSKWKPYCIKTMVLTQPTMALTIVWAMAWKMKNNPIIL